MGFSGRLEGIAPSDIFQIISQNRMTGTLIARCPDGTAMVVFKEGQVIEAASDAERESLSHLLVSQGMVSKGTIEAAEQQMKNEPDRTLGAVLVDMRAITAKALEAVVLKQIGYIVHRLMSCDDGFLTFDRGETAVKRKINTREFLLPSGISPEFLIMERARIIDEDRRRGIDRRSQARDPLPGIEAPQAAGGDMQGLAASAAGTLLSRFRGILLLKAAALRSAAETAVRKGKELSVTAFQKGKQFAASASDWLRRGLIPRLSEIGSKARAFSPDGKALIFAGAGVIAAGAALFLLTASSSRTSGGDLLVTGRIVNIRANPATSGKVVAKVERGDTVSSVTFSDGWHQVRTRTGETGWVWKSLVERKEPAAGSKGAGRGRMVLVLPLIAGAALLGVGVLRKRRAMAPAPRTARRA